MQFSAWKSPKICLAKITCYTVCSIEHLCDQHALQTYQLPSSILKKVVTHGWSWAVVIWPNISHYGQTWFELTICNLKPAYVNDYTFPFTVQMVMTVYLCNSLETFYPVEATTTAESWKHLSTKVNIVQNHLQVSEGMKDNQLQWQSCFPTQQKTFLIHGRSI